ncbi:MBL fold metallo-hydrolase [Sphingomonas glacialis]|uniref:MBL fold metallo-hydrolase n=1 Tax=Sphingomonas glacialis TaxID=658225 RepID=A0A502FRP1_9SPHN|nr:MBL fold metallo-hydrolase [Sphingomonas glacialis]TPG52060.1 MBL fold metallo-hydrolase [Sphingomonas glacialis]
MDKNSLRAVDRLEITVLIDNRTDSLSSVPPEVTLEWNVLHQAGMNEMTGSCQCCANHGLALIVRAEIGAERRTMLFDAGPVDFAVEYNGTRIGVPFKEIDAAMLSHGHWDHAGGLPMALELIGGTNVPVYLHPGMFRQRAFHLPGGDLLPIRDIPGPAELRSKGGDPIVIDHSTTALDDMFFVSGEIPRVTPYETGLPGHMRRTEHGDGWELDPLIVDERYLAVNVRDKGLVIFSACSHAGIVNVLHAARRDMPDVPVHAVIGGYHLSGANEAIIDKTVADFEQFDVDLILPGHCTGWRAVNALERAFGPKVVPIAVGMKISL